MAWKTLLSIFSLVLVITIINGQHTGGGRYYGLPVGSFHFTRDATKGDVYAADPRTLMVVNFRHHPRKPGCTTYMVGPRKEGNGTTTVKERGRDTATTTTAQGVMLPVRIRSAGPVAVSEAQQAETTTTTTKPSGGGDYQTTTKEPSIPDENTVQTFELRRKKRNIGLMMSQQISALNAQLTMDQRQQSGELAKLRLGEEEQNGPSHQSLFNIDGRESDLGQSSSGSWIGPQLPPVATTTRSRVTRIRPAKKQMMPIGELMKMQAAKKAKKEEESPVRATTQVPAGLREFPLNVQTSAPVIRRIDEIRQQSIHASNSNSGKNVMIVFDPEEGDEVQHRPRASAISINGISDSNRRRVTPRPRRRTTDVSRRRNRNQSSSRQRTGARNNTNNRNRRTTTRRPRSNRRTTRRPRNNRRTTRRPRSNRRTTQRPRNNRRTTRRPRSNRRTTRRPRNNRRTTRRPINNRRTTRGSRNNSRTTRRPINNRRTTRRPRNNSRTTRRPRNNRRTTTRRPRNNRRTTQRPRNNRRTTTRRPRNDGQLNGGPRRPHPGWEPKGWTPTLPYKRRGMSTASPLPRRSRNRTNTPPRQPNPPKPAPASPRPLQRGRSIPPTAVPTTPTGFRSRQSATTTKPATTATVTSSSTTSTTTITTASSSTSSVLETTTASSEHLLPNNISTNQLSSRGEPAVDRPPFEINHGLKIVPRRRQPSRQPAPTPLTSVLETTTPISGTSSEQIGGEEVRPVEINHGLQIVPRRSRRPSFSTASAKAESPALETTPSDSQNGRSPPQIGPGLIQVDPNDEKAAMVPEQVHSRFLRPLPRFPELYEPVEDNGLVIHEAPIEFKTNAQSQSEAKEEVIISTTTKSSTTSSTSTPLALASTTPIESPTEKDEWWVVADPRTRNPSSVPQENRDSSQISKFTTAQPYSTPVLPTSAPGSSETFALPDVNGETILLELPEEHTINDYSWFGIYDHCEGLRTASVSLKDLTPPAEATINGVTGWQFETGSKEIVVINCNTILLRGFTFKGQQFSNSYIYVGTGEFPSGILQHVQASVIDGDNQSDAESPLRDYDNEDVIVRLPGIWKTLDISFISVFNPTERTSYGHAEIPPVVVPPCEKDLLF